MKSTVAGGMMAIGSGGDGDLGDNESASGQYDQEKPLDFSHISDTRPRELVLALALLV